MRRAGGVDRRRRAAAASRDRRDRRGHHRAQEIRLSLHQRAAAGKEDRPVQAEPYFIWSVHLDGDQEMHDHSVCQDGVYDRAVAAIKLAKAKGFRVNINCTLFDGAEPERVAQLLRRRDGDRASTASRSRRAMPMSARRTRQHFLNRSKTKKLFRDIFRRGASGKQMVVQPVGAVPRFPRRQPDLSLHALGQPDAQRISAGSGPATCSAKATPRPSRS